MRCRSARFGLRPCTGDNEIKVAALGGIECVLEVVRGHPAHVKLLTVAMGALNNISFNGNGECDVMA